jgi:hypothetical protein
MTKYLISFPSEAMVVPEEDFEAVVEASHAVIEEAKAAGSTKTWTRCSWPPTAPSPRARGFPRPWAERPAGHQGRSIQ